MQPKVIARKTEFHFVPVIVFREAISGSIFSLTGPLSVSGRCEMRAQSAFEDSAKQNYAAGTREEGSH